jgi:hypothetical protein
MAQQTMMYLNISLATNHNIRMLCTLIGKEIQCENYRSIGRVFEWDDAEIGFSGLYLAEDVFDCCLWRKRVVVLIEST